MSTGVESAATRDGFGRGLLEAAAQNESVVGLEADLGNSVRMNWMRDKFPERVFNFGISEQDMIAAAAGFESCGKIPVASTFAIFTERAFEQVRNTIARLDKNVKIFGSHAGLITGTDGKSAQSIEDMAIYRALPNMVVLCPADSIEAELATLEMILKHKGPIYMRGTRDKVPIIYNENYKFKIGKGDVVHDGSDVTVIACGPQVYEALQAAEELHKEKISVRVVNMTSIKPLDDKLVEKCAKETGAIVTAEDHNVIGGLGGAVAESLVSNYPAPVERVGMQDVFGESGQPGELYEKYGLDSNAITAAVKKVLKRK